MSTYGNYVESVRQRFEAARIKRESNEYQLRRAAAFLIDHVRSYAEIPLELPEALALCEYDGSSASLIQPTELSDFPNDTTLRFGLSFKALIDTASLGSIFIPVIARCAEEDGAFILNIDDNELPLAPDSAESVETASEVWNILTRKFDEHHR